MKMNVVHPDRPAAVEQPRRRRLRSVSALPTLFTLANLICGFAATYFCMRGVMRISPEAPVVSDAGPAKRVVQELLLPGPLALGAYFVFLAMLCDAIDGRLARVTRRSSDFGGQLDSLADIVSFGVAPAMLMIALIGRQVQGGWLHGEWLVTPLGDKFARAVWLMGAAYVACTALRLARYNVEVVIAKPTTSSFRGLPSPAAAGALVSLILLHEWVFNQEAVHGSFASQRLVKSLPVVALVLGLLMVSRIPYVHVANVYLRGRQPVGRVWLLLIGAVFIWWLPELAPVVLMGLYAIGGPSAWLVRRLRLASVARRAHDAAGAEEQSSGRRADNRAG